MEIEFEWGEKHYLSLLVFGPNCCLTLHSTLDTLVQAFQPTHSANRHDAGGGIAGPHRLGDGEVTL